MFVSNVLVKLVKTITSVLKYSSHKHKQGHRQRQGIKQKGGKVRGFRPFIHAGYHGMYSHTLWEVEVPTHTPRDQWPLSCEYEPVMCWKQLRTRSLGKLFPCLTASICFGAQTQIPLHFFFFLRKQWSYKTTRTENTQIRCLFIRFQKPPDIRKTLVIIDGNCIFGNTEVKHV